MWHLLIFLLLELNMAIYKDYGSPPSYNTTQHVAGTSGNQRGNYTIIGEQGKSQYRGGKEALPALAVRQAESVTEFTTTGNSVLNLGDLDVVEQWVSNRQGLSTVFVLTEKATAETLTVVWTGSGLQSAESATNTVFKLVADDDASGNLILVGVDASNNLTISPGVNISGLREYEISRLSDYEITEAVYLELLALGENPDSADITAILEKYGIDYLPAVGGDWFNPPTGPVRGNWVGWLLGLMGQNVALSVNEYRTIPMSFTINNTPFVDAPIQVYIGRSSTVSIGITGSGAGRTLGIGGLIGLVLGAWGNDGAAFYNTLEDRVLLVPTEWDSFIQEAVNQSVFDNCSSNDSKGPYSEAENCLGIPFSLSAVWNDTWVQGYPLVTGGWVGSGNLVECSGTTNAGCCTECIWPNVEFGWNRGGAFWWEAADNQAGN